MLGLNWKWNFLKRFSFYGQFVLDELAIGSIIDNGFGWWGNKFGIQAGLKYFNVAEVDHLDAQIEFNMVRPYMYSFRDSSANWTHYNQFLANCMLAMGIPRDEWETGKLITENGPTRSPSVGGYGSLMSGGVHYAAAEQVLSDPLPVFAQQA